MYEYINCICLVAERAVEMTFRIGMHAKLNISDCCGAYSSLWCPLECFVMPEACVVQALTGGWPAASLLTLALEVKVCLWSCCVSSFFTCQVVCKVHLAFQMCVCSQHAIFEHHCAVHAV